MRRLSNLLVAGALVLAGALVVLNWSVMTAPARLDFVFAQIEAPLGVVLLGFSGVLIVLFFIAYMQNQIGALLETRRLLKEVTRAHELADKAEASRIENLHQLIATEFRLLNERMNVVVANAPAATPAPAANESGNPTNPVPFAGLPAPM